jgi:hypothetical protein
MGITTKGVPYVAGNLYTAPPNLLPETKVGHGADREILSLWALNEKLDALRCPVYARCPRYEFGPSSSDTQLSVDHPINSVLEMSDGKLHNFLTYRMMDAASTYYDFPPASFAGSYTEELFC